MFHFSQLSSFTVKYLRHLLINSIFGLLDYIVKDFNTLTSFKNYIKRHTDSITLNNINLMRIYHCKTRYEEG